ncbi:metallophosphoesterase [Candidatus Woesearchaeota archaeon]|nr:metallophosphoesterase [Candidatus Woesearchaeota archaeon]
MKNLIKRTSYSVVVIVFIFSNISFKPISPNEKSKDLLQSESDEFSFYKKNSISDGPYIFLENERVVVKWIQHNELRFKIIRKNNYKIIKKKFELEFNPSWIDDLNNSKNNYTQTFSGVENLVAVSDVHGQFDLLIKLLKQHKVIDNHFNWAYDDGHLVILGDVFDRGKHVTEILWLIYKLEQQAKEKGGMVHVMMGNHELMVFNNDLRYVHEKYIKSATLMSTTYDQLFTEESFLGKWLKNKPYLVSINDMLFVHAGVSPELVEKGLSKEQINKLFINKIVGKDKIDILADPELSLLRGKYGPLWYRGYFIKPRLPENEVDKLLKYFQANHIIVGHTSLPNIISLYHGKVIGIDSSIKLGDTGEIFIYKNDKFFRGSSNGTLIEL